MHLLTPMYYFKPSYTPHNGAANILVRSLAEGLGLSFNKKYEIILSSFLAVAKKVNGQTFDWMKGNDDETLKFWNLFPSVSSQSIQKVYNLLNEHEYIKSSSDFPNYIRESIGIGKPNWIKANRLPKNFLEEASFIESNLPSVLVNTLETYESKSFSINEALTAPKLDIKQAKQKFGKDYMLAHETVLKMNELWSKYPLYNPMQNEFYSSARRLFHNGSIKSGGRWYGGWTDFETHQRLSFTINDNPVVQVDVNAMILSLLSSMTGKPMHMIGVFKDIYQPVLTKICEIANARDKLKQVIMELTSSGNPYIEKPFLGSDIFDNVDEFIYIRDLCLQAYPALKCLDNEYFNFTNALSYHEANILTQTLINLKEKEIVAYPIHDCVIVRLGDEFEAVETFKKVFKEYVFSFQARNDLPRIDLDIALTVEFDPSSKLRVEGSSG